MTVDKSKFNEIQEIPKGGLLNVQRANGGVLSFDDVEYVPGGGGGSLASLSDVNITSPQEGDLLRYTGGKWRNAADKILTILPVTWSPADIAQPETTLVATIPGGSVLLPLAATNTQVYYEDGTQSPALSPDCSSQQAIEFATPIYVVYTPGDTPHGANLTLTYTFCYLAGAIHDGGTAPIFPNLAARWRAADIVGLTDGQAVASWADSVGGHTLTQATAGKRPVYNTNVLNTTPVVTFDDFDDALVSTLDPGTTFTVVALFRSTAADQLVNRNAIGGTSWSVGVGSDGMTGLVGAALDGTFNNFTPQGGAAMPAAQDDWFAVAVRQTPGSLGIVTSFDKTGGTFGSEDAPATIDGGAPGALTVGAIGAATLGGQVAEILVYARRISDAEQRAIGHYFDNTYGFTGML